MSVRPVRPDRLLAAAGAAGRPAAPLAQPAAAPPLDPPAAASPASAVPPPAILLADVDAGRAGPSRYLVGEGFDRTAATRDGATLRFRSGRPLPAPAWLTARLPAGPPLDGELRLGRSRFDARSAIVRRKPPVGNDWRQTRHPAFELPGGTRTSAKRARHVDPLGRDAGWPQLQTVEQAPVTDADADALRRRLAEVVARGRRGADAPGRSTLRDRPQRRAAEAQAVAGPEATAVAHRAGKGPVRRTIGRLARLHAGPSAVLDRERSRRCTATPAAAGRRRRHPSLPRPDEHRPVTPRQLPAGSQ